MKGKLIFKSAQRIVMALAFLTVSNGLSKVQASTIDAPVATEVVEVVATEAPAAVEVVEATAVAEAAPVVESAPVVAEEISSTSEATEVVSEEAVATSTPAASVEATVLPTEPSPTITIAHTNDMHGRILPDRGVIGMAQASEYFKQIEADVIVDAGDAFQGLPLSNHDQGATMAEAMKLAGYDAMAVGNHEFDFGQEQATSYENLTGFPLLAANITKDGKLLYNPTTVLNVDGYNLGVVAVSTPETKTKTHPNNVQGVEFEAPIQTAQKYINQMIADQTVAEDAFIVLSHLGVDPITKLSENGMELAKTLDADTLLDNYQIIVIDGHSHTALPTGSTFGNVIYAQTGTALNNIGVIEFDPTKPGSATAKLVSEADVVAALNGTTDTSIKALVDNAKAKYDAETSAIIVENNPVWLNGVREYVRSHETNMGTLITDAMVDYGRNGGFNNPTDFAMINGGGIRADIAAGKNITIGDVVAVLPFGNIASQIEVTGSQIYDMFELAYSAPQITEPYTSSDGLHTVEVVDADSNTNSLSAAGGFLQVSSDITIFFDPTKDEGSRVLGVYLRDPETKAFNLVPNEATNTYFMATNDFLAQGGDGYSMLSGAREEGPSLDQVVMNRLQRTDARGWLESLSDALPQNNIRPVLTADFLAAVAELTKPTITPLPEVKPAPTPGTGVEPEAPTKDPVDSAKDPVKKPASAKPVSAKPAKAAASQASLPQTGELADATMAVGLILVFGGTVVVLARKKETV